MTRTHRTRPKPRVGSIPCRHFASKNQKRQKIDTMEGFASLIPKVDRDKFLVGKLRLGVIARSLKTGFRLSKVNLANKHIELNPSILHCKNILPAVGAMMVSTGDGFGVPPHF